MERNRLASALRKARTARGYSQLRAASYSGLPRSAIVQIEAGRRAVRSDELVRLANLYDCPLDSLLAEADGEEGLLVILRREAPGLLDEGELGVEIERCVGLCKEGGRLQAQLGRDRGYGPPARMESTPSRVRLAIAQAETAAEEERLRLGIGVGPIRDMAGLIDSQGIWVSEVRLPDPMSGLFLRHPEVRFAILVNADHPHRRKRFSYAHEYAHALFDRDRTVAVSGRDNASHIVEKRANAFAGAFLMPGQGMRRRLGALGKAVLGRQEQAIYGSATGRAFGADARRTPAVHRITSQDAALVSHHFDVSYQAAVYRMKNLRLVSQPDAERLLEHEGAGRRFLQSLELRRSAEGRKERGRPSSQELNKKVASLAIEAYARDRIGKGDLRKLFQLTDLDLGQFRQVIDQLREQLA